MHRICSTYTDVITAIAAAIEAGGEASAHEYDLHTIARACYIYVSPKGAAQRAGYVSTVTPEMFWKIVEAHAYPDLPSGSRIISIGEPDYEGQQFIEFADADEAEDYLNVGSAFFPEDTTDGGESILRYCLEGTGWELSHPASDDKNSWYVIPSSKSD